MRSSGQPLIGRLYYSSVRLNANPIAFATYVTMDTVYHDSSHGMSSKYQTKDIANKDRILLSLRLVASLA